MKPRKTPRQLLRRLRSILLEGSRLSSQLFWTTRKTRPGLAVVCLLPMVQMGSSMMFRQVSSSTVAHKELVMLGIRGRARAMATVWQEELVIVVKTPKVRWRPWWQLSPRRRLFLFMTRTIMTVHLGIIYLLRPRLSPLCRFHRRQLHHNIMLIHHFCRTHLDLPRLMTTNAEKPNNTNVPWRRHRM